MIDPVFYNVLIIKRQSPLPVDPNLLRNLNYILLSHDHHDHLDGKSLKLLAGNNPDVTYLAGLNSTKLIRNITHSSQIQTAGWYQRYNTNVKDIKITFVPSRHWSRHALLDTNKRLWGGFVIEAKGKRIFFSGDSGYADHFRQIGELFKSFDYCITGIGAYEPKWFMHTMHQSPADALKAFKHLNARYFIPMHYGTFDLSDEPLQQPLKDLYKAAEAEGLKEKLLVFKIGGRCLSIDIYALCFRQIFFLPRSDASA